MQTIILKTFGGEIPAISPRLLETTQAVAAINCQLQSGDLEPLRGPRRIAGLASAAKTVFKHEQDGWLSWPEVVSVLKSAVLDAEGEKPLGLIYIAGYRPYPIQRLAGGEACRLGLPRPERTPIASIRKNAAQGNAENYPKRSSSYCYTLVRSLAGGIVMQESAPSPPTEILDVLEGESVLLGGFVVPNLPELKVTHIRIYRTQAGNQSSEFHFLAELPVATKEWLDETHDADLSSEVLQTSSWDCIPDAARGLIVTDNGIYACFRGNELLLSEPNIPYAFPAAYRLLVEDRIVALAHTDNTIVVLTEGRPYLAVGGEPGQMQMTHLPIEQACVSARSVASLPGGVIYASPDGLMLFSSSEQSVVSASTFTREQWREMGPERLMGVVLDGKYIGFFEGSNHGFIFSPGARDVVRVELEEGWVVRGLYCHSRDDCLYLSIGTPDGEGIYQWEAGEPLEYRWRSKPFACAKLDSVSALRVIGEQKIGNPVTARVFGPDEKRARASLTLTGKRTARIAPTRAEYVWSLELSGKAKVFEASLGASVEAVEYGE